MTTAKRDHLNNLSLSLFGILLAVFVIAGFGNALHKGGDFTVSLTAGQRFLDGSPLYEGSSPGAGVTGPPFQSVWFAPFAAIAAVHVGLSRILWYIANVAFLLAGVALSTILLPLISSASVPLSMGSIAAAPILRDPSDPQRIGSEASHLEAEAV